MHVSCPDCATRIKAGDIDLGNLVAKCHGCDSVFSIGGHVDHPVSALTRPEVARPDSIQTRKTGVALILSTSWFHPALLFMVFFCVAWDSFLVFWYSMALTTKAPWIMVVFPIGHVAVGVCLTYTTLAGFLNRTTIEVSTRKLAVEHGPLPWWGNTSIPSHDIEQIHCEESISKGKNGTTSRYNVMALLKSGKKLALLSGLDTADKALYIEQQIEQYLSIEDRPVRGEIPRAN